MKKHISQKTKLLSLLFLFLLPFTLQASEALQRFLASGSVDPQKTAVLVVDLETGNVLESHNPEKPLIPASTMKNITVASLLNAKGKDYRYQTKVFTDGGVEKGVLKGNIIIEGSGDPTINSAKEPFTGDFVDEIVGALEKKGVERIEGAIIVDQSIFPLPEYPESWPDNDKPHSYGTGCFGFNFENNSSGKSSVKNPSAVFINKLRSRLAGKGITITEEKGKGDGIYRHLFTHESAPMEDIMRSCMMRSDNLYAEALLRTYAVESGKKGTPDEGAQLEEKYWKLLGADMKNVKLLDGSGLSRDNRVTAQFMTDVLTNMAENVEYASFFPLAGQEGTLKRFLKDSHLDAYVALKTGTLKDVKCYAGYKLDDDFAPTHSIVIMINRSAGSNADASAAAANFLKEVFPNP